MPEVIICFAQSVAKRVRSPVTVSAAVSAIKKLHRTLGASTQAFKDYVLNLTLQGITRNSKHVPKQARPITPDLLIKMHAVLNFDDISDCAFWLTCILAFFLLLRKSNILPTTKNGFDPLKQLCWDDIVHMGRNLIVGIRWSKTDQFGRELKTYPIPILADPWKALCRMANSRCKKPEGMQHICLLDNNISYTYNQFQSRLRVVLAAVGVAEPDSYSSHSFRRGGATFAYVCGVPPEIIKLLGNWKSNCFLKYLHLPLEARLAASELIKARLVYHEHRF